jgi:acetate kinase
MNPILAVNSGSSTLKFGLFVEEGGEERALLKGAAEGIGKDTGKLEIFDGDGKTLRSETRKYASQKEAFSHVADSLGALAHAEPSAIGHRVVHGGAELRGHARITPDVLKKLSDAVHFAPLHIPNAVDLIRHAESIYADLPQFACFDTAFHQTLPEKAYRFALPKEFLDHGVRRYGFHGLSYASIVHQLGAALKPRTVVAHLGNGASLAAIREGKSVDTSMGLTPTGGIPMGTRTGDLDPGVLLYLSRTEKVTGDALETLLNHKSGLLALGGTSDMRDLQAAAARGEHEAQLTIEMFCLAIARTVAAYAVSLEGLDMLVFAGGIGEHSSQVRANVCAKLKIMGVGLDDERNKKAEGTISSADSPVQVRIVPAQEEAQIAREVRRLCSVAS